MTTPQKHDLRIVAHLSNPFVLPESLRRTGAYYTVEEWKGCYCPDCEKDGHWEVVMGTPDLADADAYMERRG